MIPRLQSWCREAAERFGDDWPKVKAYVEEKIATLGEKERELLNQEAELAVSLGKKTNEAHN